MKPKDLLDHLGKWDRTKEMLKYSLKLSDTEFLQSITTATMMNNLQNQAYITWTSTTNSANSFTGIGGL